MAGEMTDAIIEVWTRMYEEQVRHARHHESLRAQSTNVIVGISAAVLAFYAAGQVSDARQYTVGTFLIIINAYGLLMSMKHYERSRLHVTVGSQYRDALSALTPLNGVEINRARLIGRQAHSRSFRATRAIRAYILWCGLHIMLGLMGLSIMVVK